MKAPLTLAALLVAATPVLADETAITTFDGSAGDAAFAVENAILGQGLVIDSVSHVGEMLARTGADLDLGPSPVGEEAQVFLFCSASVSREVMEADPMNVAFCPYGIFVAEIDGETLVGHRVYPGDTMAPVNELLETIVAEASE